MTTQLEQQLNDCVTRGRVLTAPAQLAGYDADALGYKRFCPDAVAIPADADELVHIVQHAKQLNVPICMRGAGTSLAGGPVAAQGGLVVHTSQLRNVNRIDADGLWCEVESGVALNRLDEQLKPYGLFYPPDPSSGPVCTLGGNVAMNAGGAHCFRYGVTSNYVLGVEAVLTDGNVHRFGGPAGGRGPWREDWKRLMVGSEGTLAVFTRFWLRLLPRPEKVWTFRATYQNLIDAERAIHALVAHQSFPVAIELMDPRCVEMVENSPMAVGLPKDSFMILTEIDGPETLVNARVESVAEILRKAGSTDVVFSDDEEQRQKLWKARKVAGGLAGQISPDFLVQDAVIPKSALADVLQLVYDEGDAAGLPAMNVFHAGDGNLHPNFLFDSRIPGELEKVEQFSKRLMQRVVEVGGTLSGEHGIGNDKSAYMPLVFGEEMMRLQLAVPAAFNPRHQLNPLKVFEQRRFERGEDGRASDNGKEAPGTSKNGRDSRCFEPFIDAIDGICCVPATAKANDIRQQAAPLGLRFPFVMDTAATLHEHVLASGYAPASSRFGPLCDNIVGMNWKLPNGRVVRFGERVVKTTTGYDLFRFLLSSGDRFGEPVDYVIRLRTDGGMTAVCQLTGETGTVEEAVPKLLQTCWIHWFDSMDVVTGLDAAASLRIVINCPAEEREVVEQFLLSFANQQNLSLDADFDSTAPTDGCPDLALKTTPDRVIAVAKTVTSKFETRCIAMCAPGVVHVYANGDPSVARDVVQASGDEVQEVGGDWHSRHIPDADPNPAEQAWLDVLETEFRKP